MRVFPGQTGAVLFSLSRANWAKRRRGKRERKKRGRKKGRKEIETDTSFFCVRDLDVRLPALPGKTKPGTI
jgi:hypothetical protein